MKMKKILMSLAVVIAAMGSQSHAFDLKGVLGNLGGAGDVVNSVVDGLFTQSDITVAQMAGTWTASGPAVTFLSDNFLKKAGGSVASSTIESKLAPYYNQYGLTGSVLTITSDGNFTLKVKGISLNGNITKRSDGNFDFAFTPFGAFKLGEVKAYVEKTPSGLNVMFDASKLKSLLSTVAGLTGNSLASAAGSVLDSYDGLCVGFAFTGTGNNTNTPSSTTTNNTTTNNNNQTQSNGSNQGSDLLNKATNALRGLFGK